jgi:predicted transcriptional regulator
MINHERESQIVMIDARQIRAARAWLDWSQMELSRRSGVSQKTIADLERGNRSGHARTLADIRRAFEDEGGIFLFDAQGDCVGVKFQTSSS